MVRDLIFNKICSQGMQWNNWVLVLLELFVNTAKTYNNIRNTKSETTENDHRYEHPRKTEGR